MESVKYEDVVRALEMHISERSDCNACPYDVETDERCSVVLCRDALALLRESKWIPVTEHLPESSDNFVLAVVNGKYGNITFQNAIQIADYSKREGWFVDGYEHLGPVNVTHWMPLPKGPEVMDGE